MTITVSDGDATGTTNLLYNADWSQTFTAPQNMTIASLTVAGEEKPAAVGAVSYTVQLFGVIEDTAVVATYREEEEAGFSITSGTLRWTGFDPATGVATFTATTEGDAPQTITVVYRTALDGNDQTADCTLTLENGTGTVTLPASLLQNNALFLVGFDVE